MGRHDEAKEASNTAVERSDHKQSSIGQKGATAKFDKGGSNALNSKTPMKREGTTEFNSPAPASDENETKQSTIGKQTEQAAAKAAAEAREKAEKAEEVVKDVLKPIEGQTPVTDRVAQADGENVDKPDATKDDEKKDSDDSNSRESKEGSDDATKKDRRDDDAKDGAKKPEAESEAGVSSFENCLMKARAAARDAGHVELPERPGMIRSFLRGIFDRFGTAWAWGKMAMFSAFDYAKRGTLIAIQKVFGAKVGQIENNNKDDDDKKKSTQQREEKQDGDDADASAPQHESQAKAPQSSETKSARDDNAKAQSQGSTAAVSSG